MTRYLHVMLLCLAVGYGSLACAPHRVAPTTARPFQFVVYGDMPYGTNGVSILQTIQYL
jgi:hypothetical protein